MTRQAKPWLTLAVWAVLGAAVSPSQAEGPARLRVLILCTGNSARSQMTEGFLRSLDSRLEVHSAGTKPAPRVNPFAIQAMKEIGIDISSGQPKSVEGYLGQSFDFVITVCDDADKNCPRFSGKVGRRLHLGFPDPAKATGTDEQKLAVFRTVRDDIRTRFTALYRSELAPALAAKQAASSQQNRTN
ncbi:MAG: arsenate reductase ArsC [Bryobacteraceae bacterium]|nr:arsenate reductase ArsC [Bryobacteraceae bacterium]MDW8376965.1 arsenate reductase ArsC [Bryobacterales bacterium]